MRRVIVVGAGLAGVTTAYELARRGYETTLLERRERVALEASFANGALLTPSMADPWNGPGVHRQLLASLFNTRAAMKLRLRALPSLVGWGIRFLRHSSDVRHTAATRANFLLAHYSRAQMQQLRTRLRLSYEEAARGTLKVFRSPQSMERPLALARVLGSIGLRFEVLGADQAVAIEPALADIRGQIAGALRFPDDECGDAHQFCEQLAEAFVKEGGRARYDACVSGLVVEHGAVTGVRLGTQLERADAVVIAAGSSSAALVRPLGIALPVRPAKGYTLTFDLAQIAHRPRVPIVDDGLHAAVVPLGRRLRIAGTAEFAANDLQLRPERIANLHRLFGLIFPQLAARLPPSTAQAWTGLRPMSADGLPYIGRTRVERLHLNTGHGHLGWTLAAGSARLLADLMEGRSLEIDAAPYLATR